ncbi:MAG: hypothetical protein EOP11_21535 [Proteobacteria bacterium]|nr:MAG: hypothetical protein EOP11_21535 [Pseudomonadota bacterium]
MKSVATSAKQALMNAVSGKTSLATKAKPGKAPAKPATKAAAKPSAKQNSKNAKAPQEDSNVGRMLSGVKKKLAALPSLVGGTTDTSSVPKGAKVSITEIARDMKARAESTRTKAPNAKAAFAAGNKGPGEGTKTRAANNTTGKGGHKALDQAGGRHH